MSRALTLMAEALRPAVPSTRPFVQKTRIGMTLSGGSNADGHGSGPTAFFNTSEGPNYVRGVSEGYDLRWMCAHVYYSTNTVSAAGDFTGLDGFWSAGSDEVQLFNSGHVVESIFVPPARGTAWPDAGGGTLSGYARITRGDWDVSSTDPVHGTPASWATGATTGFYGLARRMIGSATGHLGFGAAVGTAPNYPNAVALGGTTPDRLYFGHHQEMDNDSNQYGTATEYGPAFDHVRTIFDAVQTAVGGAKRVYHCYTPTFFGTVLDADGYPQQWTDWRPTIANIDVFAPDGYYPKIPSGATDHDPYRTGTTPHIYTKTDQTIGYQRLHLPNAQIGLPETAVYAADTDYANPPTSDKQRQFIQEMVAYCNGELAGTATFGNARWSVNAAEPLIAFINWFQPKTAIKTNGEPQTIRFDRPSIKSNTTTFGWNATQPITMPDTWADAAIAMGAAHGTSAR